MPTPPPTFLELVQRVQDLEAQVLTLQEEAMARDAEILAQVLKVDKELNQIAARFLHGADSPLRDRINEGES